MTLWLISALTLIFALLLPVSVIPGAMVSVDAARRYSGPRVRRALDLIAALASLTLIAIIIWWGWDYPNRGKVQTVIGLEGVTMFWAYLALPVGGLFSVLAIIGNLLDPQRQELESAL